MAAPIPVKSQQCLLFEKQLLLRNASTNTWDWKHHLVGDRALLCCVTQDGQGKLDYSIITDILVYTFVVNFYRYIAQVSKENIDCLRFVICPILAPHFQLFYIFLLQPLLVLMRQTRQAVCAFNQSIFLRCQWIRVGKIFFAYPTHIIFEIILRGRSSFIQTNSGILIDTVLLLANKIISAELQSIRQTQKFDQLGHCLKECLHYDKNHSKLVCFKRVT